MIKLSDYEYSLLRDGDLRLYRGRRPDAGSILTILIVVPADEDPSADCIARLQNEFALRSDLDMRWAARPVALARHDDRIALVLDDPAGLPLRQFCDAPLDIGAFLPWAISLTSAIEQTHARGLIHRDICPENVLIDIERNEIRLTGFGLASRAIATRAGAAAPLAAPFAASSAAPLAALADPLTTPLTDEFANHPAGHPADVSGTQMDVDADGHASELILMGHLAYMAPEQTGRTGRSSDARSDLYALGCTFYELLTGSAPHSAADPLSWIHTHVARQPAPPAERVDGVPEQLSRMVMKLLAKSPEDRYQSAAGLLADLKRCLADWQVHGRVELFAPDARGVAYRLKVSERLYGRDTEIATLLDAYARVASTGRSEFVRIAGHSGSGKSSLVREIRNRLPVGRHRFAAGKCEQVKRSIPYAGLAQALQGLVRPVLGLDESAFEGWSLRIAHALGPNARLLTAIVPDLVLLLGDAPPVPDLPPQEEKARFLRVAARLISAFATADEPLVLFIDDLQWMDAGTQAVIDYLAFTQPVPYLLTLCAFRDNELPASEPIRAKQSGTDATRFSDIGLGPLDPTNLAELVSDVLDCSSEHAMPLAHVVCNTTRGDPFFSIQFIASLAEEGLIAAGNDAGSWARDLDRIRARGYADNVVDLMLRKLDLLPRTTRGVLEVLACLGSGASVPVLAQATGLAPDALDTALDEACAANLAYRLDQAYLFWHDRIQEAAYASIPPGSRAALHLTIGRRLATLATRAGSGNTLFETVGQINRGAIEDLSPVERETFAALNLEAGRQAKSATAYVSAIGYLEAAATLLDPATPGEIADAVELHRAECEFLTGSPSVAEQRLDALTKRALPLPLRAHLTRLRIAIHTTRDRIDMALEAGHDYFREVGVDVPTAPDTAEVDREFARMHELMAGREIESLASLPLMSDPVWRATMDVFADLVPCALFTNENLHELIRLRMTNLSLEHGHCDASCYGYACLIHIFGARSGDYDTGYQFAELARFLMNERGLTRFRARVELSFGALVLPWKRPVKSGQTFMRYALQNAIESGDRVFELLCRRNLVSNLIFAGNPVEEAQREAETGLGFAQQARFGMVIDGHLAQIVLCRRLRGLPLDAASLLAAGYDAEWVERYARGLASPRALAAFSFWTYSLQASIVFGDIDAAIHAIESAEGLHWSARSFLEFAEFHFYAALARVAASEAMVHGARGLHLIELAEHYRRLQVWARACGDNFAGRLALVEAEIARIENRVVEAEHYYEQAVRHAQEQGFVQLEALAAELAAQFFRKRGLRTVARAYLRNARYAYLVWGAHAKVRALEARFPRLADSASLDTSLTSAPRPAPRELDISAVIRASHALSGEIVLSRLIETLMTVALEHAGAERGVLLRRHGERLEVEARATTSPDSVSVVLTSDHAELLPVTLLHTVMRTRERVMIDDATQPHEFMSDTYLLEHAPRSVMCVPLIKQGELTGLLYLENSLVAGTFTPDRVALLELLASQAAISLENARLYKALVDENTERKLAEEALAHAQSELTHVTRVVTLSGLAASIAHEVNQPLTSIVTSGEAGLRWLERDEPDTGEVATSLRRMVNEARRAAEVIAGIRALSKKTPSQKSPFDLNHLVEDTLALVRREIAQNHIVLRRGFGTGLPPITADRIQLQQVIINLLVNAIQALSTIDDRIRELAVRTAWHEADQIALSIEDNGPGIDPAHADLLFNAFFTTKASGMGMGLSICRSIIESHGGRLWTEATSRRGALFRFSLPTDAFDPGFSVSPGITLR